MPKVVSQRQIEANRRNAQLSTGPRTRRGKRNSAANALKHGLLAKNVLLACDQFKENRAHFDQLRADLAKELKPTTLIERILVEQIATCYWRMQRSHRFEIDALCLYLDQDADHHDNNVHALQTQLLQHRHDLELIAAAASLLNTPAERLTPDQAAKLDQTLKQIAADWPGVPTSRAAITDRARTRIDQIFDYCNEQVQRTEKQLETASNKREIQDYKRRITATLPENDKLVNVARYESMLNRHIHRALAQLRVMRRDSSMTSQIAPRIQQPIHPAVATRMRRRPESDTQCQ